MNFFVEDVGEFDNDFPFHVNTGNLCETDLAAFATRADAEFFRWAKELLAHYDAEEPNVAKETVFTGHRFRQPLPEPDTVVEK